MRVLRSDLAKVLPCCLGWRKVLGWPMAWLLVLGLRWLWGWVMER